MCSLNIQTKIGAGPRTSATQRTRGKRRAEHKDRKFKWHIIEFTLPVCFLLISSGIVQQIWRALLLVDTNLMLIGFPALQHHSTGPGEAIWKVGREGWWCCGEFPCSCANGFSPKCKIMKLKEDKAQLHISKGGFYCVSVRISQVPSWGVFAFYAKRLKLRMCL